MNLKILSLCLFLATAACRQNTSSVKSTEAQSSLDECGRAVQASEDIYTYEKTILASASNGKFVSKPVDHEYCMDGKVFSSAQIHFNGTLAAGELQKRMHTVLDDAIALRSEATSKGPIAYNYPYPQCQNDAFGLLIIQCSALMTTELSTKIKTASGVASETK